MPAVILVFLACISAVAFGVYGFMFDFGFPYRVLLPMTDLADYGLQSLRGEILVLMLAAGVTLAYLLSLFTSGLVFMFREGR